VLLQIPRHINPASLPTPLTFHSTIDLGVQPFLTPLLPPLSGQIVQPSRLRESCKVKKVILMPLKGEPPPRPNIEGKRNQTRREEKPSQDNLPKRRQVFVLPRGDFPTTEHLEAFVPADIMVAVPRFDSHGPEVHHLDETARRPGIILPVSHEVNGAFNDINLNRPARHENGLLQDFASYADAVEFVTGENRAIIEFTILDESLRPTMEHSWFSVVPAQPFRWGGPLATDLIRRHAAHRLCVPEHALGTWFGKRRPTEGSHQGHHGMVVGIVLDPFVRLVTTPEMPPLDFSKWFGNKAYLPIGVLRREIAARRAGSISNVQLLYKGTELCDDSVNLLGMGLLSDRVARGWEPLEIHVTVTPGIRACAGMLAAKPRDSLLLTFSNSLRRTQGGLRLPSADNRQLPPRSRQRLQRLRPQVDLRAAGRKSLGHGRLS
jgi:hypothetical protein